MKRAWEKVRIPTAKGSRPFKDKSKYTRSKNICFWESEYEKRPFDDDSKGLSVCYKLSVASYMTLLVPVIVIVKRS